MKTHSWLMPILASMLFIVACSQSNEPSSTEVPESASNTPAVVALPKAPAVPDTNHAKEIEGLLTVRWAKEPYRPDVYEGAHYPDPHRAAFGLVFKNNGNKSISAFKGTLRFLNVFDEEIMGIPEFEQDKTVPAGKETIWTGSIQTLGNEAAEELYAAEHSKVKIVVVPDLIVFVDGSRWTLAHGNTQ